MRVVEGPGKVDVVDPCGAFPPPSGPPKDEALNPPEQLVIVAMVNKVKLIAKVKKGIVLIFESFTLGLSLRLVVF